MVKNVTGNRGEAAQLFKAALAAGLAWRLAVVLLDTPLPVFAALAAMLTVQATVYESVTQGMQRLGGVAVGALLAIAATALLPASAFTVSLLVLAGLALGRLLRLGEVGALQVPVSAILIVSLHATLQEHLALMRLVDTGLGLVVGLLVNVALVAPVHLRPAAAKLQGLAEQIATQAHALGKQATQAQSPLAARQWLMRARDLDEPLKEARDAVKTAQESLKLNPRVTAAAEEEGVRLLGTVDRLAPALAALEHSAVQLRGASRILTDAVQAAASSDGRSSSSAYEYPPVMPEALASLTVALADALRAFGRAVVAVQLQDRASLPVHVTQLRSHLLVARGTLSALETDLQPGSGSVSPVGTRNWLVTGSLLSDLGRMLDEIDPDSGPHREAVDLPE